MRRHVTFIVTVIELTGSPIWDLFYYYNFTIVLWNIDQFIVGPLCVCVLSATT